MKKKISIIGGSLYGCLLAYYLSNKKYDVTIYEKGNKLLSGFNSIKIKQFKLNNGFHGFEYPRNKELINFLKNKVNLKLNRISNKRKLLIDREIIDYTAKYKNLPKKLKNIYIEKNLKFFKNQNVNFFFKKKFVKKIKKNSLRFADDFKLSQHLFIPWFLPADVKHISKDEGHKFRSLIRNKKIIPYYFIPEKGLFNIINEYFLKKFKKKKIKIIFESKFSINQDKILIKDRYNNDKINDTVNSEIIFCGSPIIILKHVNPKMLYDLKKYSRYFFNILVAVPKKNNNLPYFSELLCLNDKIFYVNRISRAMHLENNKYYFLQLEIILKNKNYINKALKKINSELGIIFGMKKHKLVGYDFSRIIYSPPKKWLNKATKIVKKFMVGKNFKVHNLNFEPINTAKVWLLLKNKIKMFS